MFHIFFKIIIVNFIMSSFGCDAMQMGVSCLLMLSRSHKSHLPQFGHLRSTALRDHCYMLTTSFLNILQIISQNPRPGQSLPALFFRHMVWSTFGSGALLAMIKRCDNNKKKDLGNWSGVWCWTCFHSSGTGLNEDTVDVRERERERVCETRTSLCGNGME